MWRCGCALPLTQQLFAASLSLAVKVKRQDIDILFRVGECLQCVDAVGWTAGRASGL